MYGSLYAMIVKPLLIEGMKLLQMLFGNELIGADLFLEKCASGDVAVAVWLLVLFVGYNRDENIMQMISTNNGFVVDPDTLVFMDAAQNCVAFSVERI